LNYTKLKNIKQMKKSFQATPAARLPGGLFKDQASAAEAAERMQDTSLVLTVPFSAST
jgi:hypothetical protein